MVCGHQPRVGAGGRAGVEYQLPGASLVCLRCCSGVNAAPVRGFLPTAWFLGQSLESASASPPSPSLPPTDCGGVPLPCLNPSPWLCLRQKAVRDLLCPSSLRLVHHPRSKGPGSQVLSQLRGQDQCSRPRCSLKQQELPDPGYPEATG